MNGERTRIAPTPSGYLHAGNGVAFLLTARLAAYHRAALRLRVDDLDADRSRPAYVQDIFDSLAWLGIEVSEGPRDPAEHERSYSQQLRIRRYEESIEVLKEQGDLYACTCSRAQLTERARKGSRTCDCRTRGIDLANPVAVWRLHLPSDAVVRMPQLHGADRLLSPAALMNDPVIRQRSMDGLPGRPAYQVASLVDDVEMDVTFIVRGEDLLPSTACQLYLAGRLGLRGFEKVRFAHHTLLKDAAGRKLSKSEGAEALRTMRAAGGGPQALRAQADELFTALLAGW